MLCVWFMSMTSCWRAVAVHFENMSWIASTICMDEELGSHECSHGAAHEPHKPATNTPEHGLDLRSVSQSTRKKFRSSPCHHIDAEIEKPQITPLELSQLQALNRQLLWLGYTMFATVAGASVTVDGTNTASHSGHDL